MLLTMCLVFFLSRCSGKNDYGYHYHFDLMASGPSMPAVLGSNPIVDFEQVDCPGEAKTKYKECRCSSDS